MDTAGTDVVSALDQHRRAFMTEFLKHNEDLLDRLRAEAVSAVFDQQENILSLAIGPVRKAMSFSADGEFYLRVDPDTYKLISVELHYFSDNLLENTRPLKIMSDLMQMAGPVALTVLPPPPTPRRSGRRFQQEC